VGRGSGGEKKQGHGYNVETHYGLTNKHTRRPSQKRKGREKKNRQVRVITPKKNPQWEQKEKKNMKRNWGKMKKKNGR